MGSLKLFLKINPMDGTGIVTGLNLVLTSAHNVWDKINQRKYSARSINFYALINLIQTAS